MTQHAYAVQAPSRPSTPALHIPDLVRGVMLLVGVFALAKLTLLSDHMRFGPLAWIAFFAYVAVAIAAAARILLIDAPAAREPSRSVQRTRQMGIFKELVIAGAGGLMLIVPAAYAIMASSQQVWAGQVHESNHSVAEFLPAALFGAAGFFMVFWRPQFVLDAQARKIVRYAFGRSIPLRVKELPYGDLSVYSDGYWITNTGHRLGDMIRGRVGKYTFELEMLHGNLDQRVVQARAMAWASALGAAYRTPEQAVDAELAKLR